MQDLAARMCSRHRGELPRSVESDGFVPQRSEVAKITAGSATEIKDAVGRVTLYSIEECRVILADIVVSRTVPEGSGEPIVKRDRRLAEAADLFRTTWFLGAAHQNRAPVSRSFSSLIHHRSSALKRAGGIGRCEGEAIAAQAFRENLASTGSVDLHAGEERQERVRAHRDDRVVVQRNEPRVLLRGKAEALGIGDAVREIAGAPVRVMRQAMERFNQPD